VSEFERLWSLLPHPPGSVVRYMARRKDGPGERVVGDFADTWEDLEHAARAWEKDGFDFYVQLNPTPERARPRCRARDITHWCWLLLDIDPKFPHADPFGALDAYLAALSRVTGQTIRPLVLDSGRGAQAWVRMDDTSLELPWLITERYDERGVPVRGPRERVVAGRTVARRVMGFWLRRLLEDVGVVSGCALDTACSDLPRVMRCPDTVNSKTGRRARIIEPGAGAHPNLVNLLLAQVPFSEFSPPPPSESGLIEGRTWPDVLVTMSRTARDFIRGGAEEPGRHKAAVATARSLKEQGLTPAACRQALDRGNERCTPEPLHQEFLDRLIRETYERDLDEDPDDVVQYAGQSREEA